MEKLKNITALKIKFLAATNTKDARIKITQTNNKNSITLGASQNLQVLEYVDIIIKKLPFIKNFAQIVDNTQTNYYTFVIISGLNYFPDYILEIENLNL